MPAPKPRSRPSRRQPEIKVEASACCALIWLRLPWPIAAMRSAQVRSLGKPSSGAAADPNSQEPNRMHAEQLRRLLLGQPERAATSAQGRSDVGLRRLPGPDQSVHAVSRMATARTAASLASSSSPVEISRPRADVCRPFPLRPALFLAVADIGL